MRLALSPLLLLLATMPRAAAQTADLPPLGEVTEIAEGSLTGGDLPGALPAAIADPAHFQNLFEPFQTDSAALSPDGRHVAYNRYIHGELWITIVAVDEPGKAIKDLRVATDGSTTAVLQARSLEQEPARVDWMGWVTNENLAFQVNIKQTWAMNDSLDIDAALQSVGDPFNVASGYVYIYDLASGEGSVALTPRDVAAPRRPGDSSAQDRRLPGADLQGLRDNTGVRRTDSLLSGDNGFDPRPRQIDAGSRPGSYSAEQSLETPSPFGPPSQEPSLTALPRDPTVVDYSPDDPDEIWVRAGPESSFDLYALDVTNGKKRILHTEHVTPGKSVLLNRKVQAEAAIPNTPRTNFPHAYQIEKGGFLSRWKDLQEAIADPEKVDFRLSPENVMGGRSFPLGFDEDPDLLYFASDIGRDTFGIYAFKRSTGELTDLAVEHPQFDLAGRQFHDFTGREDLIYDRYSRALLGVRFTAERRTAAWFRPNWQSLQTQLERVFPEHSVEILDWSRERDRFLVRTYSPVDPGAFHVFDAAGGRMIELARAAPALDQKIEAISADFTFRASGDWLTSGRVLIPREPIAEPIPLIVLCRDNFWDRLSVDFDRQAMALARMGYAVARFNGRGAWGFGRDHRLAIKEGYDEAQAADIVQLVDFLAKHVAIDRSKVALMGGRFGGFLALRTLQLYPENFRGAITIDAPFDLKEWVEETRWDAAARPELARDLELFRSYFGDESRLDEAPLSNRLEEVIRPTILFAFREEDGGLGTADYNHAYALARSLRGLNVPVELVDLHPDYLRGLPQAQSRVMAEIAAFLDQHLFEYEVGIGELEFLGEE